MFSGCKEDDQLGGRRVVELAAREYENMELEGSELPGGQRRWKGPGSGLGS